MFHRGIIITSATFSSRPFISKSPRSPAAETELHKNCPRCRPLRCPCRLGGAFHCSKIVVNFVPSADLAARFKACKRFAGIYTFPVAFALDCEIIASQLSACSRRGNHAPLSAGRTQRCLPAGAGSRLAATQHRHGPLVGIRSQRATNRWADCFLRPFASAPFPHPARADGHKYHRRLFLRARSLFR